MAAPPNVDAVFSFQHLVDNLPQWRTSVSELSTYASQRHSEFVAEYSRLLHKAKPRKQKSPSMCSVRSSDEKSIKKEDRSSTPDSSDFIEISPLEAGNRFLYAQAHRKRKPGISLRSGASGPVRFRNKEMAVIYYDAHIQSELDNLVKGIGAARNYLRKGKNAYMASQGFQLPSIGRRFEHLLPGTNRDFTKSARPSSRLLPAKTDTTVETAMNPPSGEAAFQRADKELETIQTICETAAHQAIRDGDCKLELENTIKNFDSLLVLAKTSLDTFIVEEKKKKEEEEERQRKEAEADSGERASDSTQSTLCDDDDDNEIEEYNITNKGLPSLTEALNSLKRPPVQGISSAPLAPGFIDSIEVDDDDDQSSIDIDISNFRMATATRRLRA